MKHALTSLRRAALAVALAGLFPAASFAQDAKPAASQEPSQVERRLQSVRTLVEASSAARQIEASANPRAASERAEARASVRLAEEAHAARDEKSATTLLDNAARHMLEGVRLAAGESGRASSQERDIGARIESAQALLAAQKRIAAEKAAAGGEETARQIERLIKEARAELDARRYPQAQALAQQGYLLAKASIGSMRGGDTLVRTLKFANKEEEYHYEVDRYDTHRMLVDLLAKKQAADDASGRQAIARAADLRREAEAMAGRGEHAAAIGVLENATRELVRAIRAAGVFIPG
jgi:hypothetical protein